MFSSRRILPIYFLLAVATLVSFWQLNHCDFINYDDEEYLTENPQVQNGITRGAVLWAFTTGHAANWHPVTWLSHMLDVELFGLNPHRHHLTNLLFHIANTLLLFFILNRMTDAPWKSAFVAALFALHPLHVESVAWVAERKDVLSAFFWMLTITAYVSYVKGLPVSRPPFSALRYFAVVLFFALGLMSKPMLVTLPFVLIFLDYWPLGRISDTGYQKPDAALMPRQSIHVQAKRGKSRKRRTGRGSDSSPVPAPLSSASSAPTTGFIPLLWEKTPLFVLAAISCVITLIAQQKGGAIKSTDAFPLGLRIANAIVCCVVYIRKAIWPSDLAVFYPHPGSRPAWEVSAAIILLGALTLTAIRTKRRFPYFVVGWLWFTVTLLPVIGIVQVGRQAMADRYTYIPLIGLFIIIAWLIPELTKKWRYGTQTLFALSALILAVFSVVTWIQAGYWRNGIKLYDRALEVTSSSALIHYNRGTSHFKAGNYRQAISDLDRAIEIDPGYAAAYANRGLAYDAVANHSKAIEDLSRAVDIKPELVWAYLDRGKVYSEVGNYGQAVSDFDTAVRMDPGLTLAYYFRGSVFSKLGEYRQAIEDFGRAIEAAPLRAEAYYKRGVVYDKMRDYGKAIENYDKAILADPKNAQSYNNRGVAYDRLGNYNQAISDYNRAVGIDPGVAMVFNNRGITYGKLGNYAKAIEDYNMAIELDPSYVPAYYNRGVAHADAGQDAASVEDLKKAAALGCEEAKEILKNRGINW
jgi:tetratricopeptide (TPR) repeat protein